MTSTILIREEQLPELQNLLERNKLPFKDLVLKGNQFKIYRDEGGKLIGSGGLEFYDGFALLRSVAVIETERGKAIGRSIVKDLLDHAKATSIKSVYLLTETAPVFFEGIGFKTIPRDSVPEAVKASSEFSTVCPVSAVCMSYDI